MMEKLSCAQMSLVSLLLLSVKLIETVQAVVVAAKREPPLDQILFLAK